MFMTESSFSMKAVEKRIVLFIKFRVYFGIISSLSCPVPCTLSEYVHWTFGYNPLS